MCGLANASNTPALKPIFISERQKQERRAGLPGSFLVIHLWGATGYVSVPADLFFEISTAPTIRLQNSILFKEFGLAVTAT